MPSAAPARPEPEHSLARVSLEFLPASSPKAPANGTLAEYLLRRRLLEPKVGALAAKRALAFVPDLVVGCNMPLDAQWKLQQASRRVRIGGCGEMRKQRRNELR